MLVELGSEAYQYELVGGGRETVKILLSSRYKIPRRLWNFGASNMVLTTQTHQL